VWHLEAAVPVRRLLSVTAAGVSSWACLCHTSWARLPVALKAKASCTDRVCVSVALDSPTVLLLIVQIFCDWQQNSTRQGVAEWQCAGLCLPELQHLLWEGRCLG